MNAELRHSLDQYLASIARPPSCVDAEGTLAFEAAEQLEAFAVMMPDGRVELFAGAGYVRAGLLQAIVQADEYDDFDEDLPRHVADVVARWRGEGAQWAIDVARGTGLVTLSMFVPAIPVDPADWADILDAFGRTAASWNARLEREAPNVSPDLRVGPADIGSGALLRC